MNWNKKLVFAVLVLGVAAFFAFGHSSLSFAADLGADKKIVNVDFPCPDGSFGLGNCQPNDSIPNYLNNIYKFAVGIAGLLALGMIVAGGVYYTVSAGSSDKQKDAKDMITSALFGVGLLLGSYLILKTINPQIVTLDLNFTNIEGGSLQKINPKSGLAEQGIKDVSCPDFKQVSINPPTTATFGNTCEYRKNILKQDVAIKGGDYYGEGQFFNTDILTGSQIWTYPYYRGDNPKTAQCLIYAFNNPNSFGTTTMIKMNEKIRLCPNQDQKIPSVSCTKWQFTAKGTNDFVSPRDIISWLFSNAPTPISINVPVSGGFNYTNAFSPPPIGGGAISDKQIVPGRNECYTNPKYCYDKLWVCTETKLEIGK